ncbi:WD40/YVTN/BNR-like repeat-containing protein [Polaribacter huanghezhanensis]|uniref:WD40/YVTN/BNR-like repeat-containing protein n=1 Tax=Polaribacter huanghezhanensis TaxID=1354726 RepID=UPI0026476853|nr:T9SS type A sorting domain-containing protein [Polaribacter huanghezhanensis]
MYLVLNNDTDKEKAREKYANFIKNHPYNKTLQLTKKERKAQGLPPNKYFEQEYLLEMNPNTGRTYPENVFKVQQELKSQRKLQRVPGDAADNKWVERGPNNVGGRTRVVLFDPNDATYKRVFAGGVSGGLWVNNDITDANSSWIRVGIDENLSVSCMTVDPNNSQIMYVGTGEVYTNAKVTGNGIWKSTDGGNSWVNVFNNTNDPDYQNRTFFINDIIAWNNPVTNKTEVFIGLGGAYYAAAGASTGNEFPSVYSLGLFKSVDNQDVWNRVTMPDVPGSTPNTYDALYEPNDFEIGADNTLWVATKSTIFSNNKSGGTILKSTNGSNFTVAHTLTGGARTEIAVSKKDKNKMYALSLISGVPKMEVTTDGFTTTTNITTPADADTGIPNNDFARGQGSYNLVLEVDPTDDNIIYAGGIDLFRSTNAGGAWKQISKWSNNNNLAGLNIPYAHSDQHGWAFHPTDANKAIIGNDGGVFYATSLLGAEATTTAIEARNKNYNVTQFYTVGVAPTTVFGSNIDVFLAGAQDNGTQYFTDTNTTINSSQEVTGGDGAYSAFDQDGTDAYFITNVPYNGKITLYDFITKAYRTINKEDGSNGDFINTEELDSNKDLLYSNYSSGSNYSIRRYDNIKPGGSAVATTSLTDALMNAAPSALKISPYITTQSNLYVGLKNGELLRVTQANLGTNTWTKITGANFTGSISDIEFGTNENEILVTFHNYGVVSIWYTADGGTTWANKEGDFPDVPVKAVLMNPLNPNEVIIGTQLGVWRTGNFKDASPKWIQSFNGMSNVKVTDLDVRDDNNVFASTYGRGVFSGQFSTATASIEDVVKNNKVFTMYPTVSNGEFTIFAKNTLGKANLLLFDITGKQVFSKQVDFTQNEKQPVSVNLTSGVYIVHLIDANNKKATGKVIIK